MLTKILSPDYQDSTRTGRHENKTVADVNICLQMYQWHDCMMSSDFHPSPRSKTKQNTHTQTLSTQSHGHRWFSILETWLLTEAFLHGHHVRLIMLMDKNPAITLQHGILISRLSVHVRWFTGFQQINTSTVLNSGTDLGGWSIAIVDIQFDTWRTEKAKIATLYTWCFPLSSFWLAKLDCSCS